MKNMDMLEIGKGTVIDGVDFKKLITLLFGRHGNIGFETFSEEGEGISSEEMQLFYLKISKSHAKELFTESEFELFLEEDGEFHIATWQGGKGWIVDFSITRRLLTYAAHSYETPQPCINCEIYKKRVEQVGKDNWTMNKICQECICGTGWPNFEIDIQEEEYI